MVSIRWCIEHKDGIRILQPNANMSDSYLKMAEESIGVLKNIGGSKIWTATTSYYIFYYSLYSLMLRLGIKCEIHSCSLEFMRSFLGEFYSAKDMEMIEKAFKARTDLQYYANRPVDEKVIEEIKAYCKDFYVKTKNIIIKITEQQINSIRKKLIEQKA